MGAIKLKHTSGNGTILNSPAANPSSDITLKLPSTTGSAGQVLQVASANHSATNAELEFAAAGGGKILQVVSAFSNTHVSSSSTSYIDLTGLTATITPASSSNKILIICSIALSKASNHSFLGRIVRDGSAISGSGGVKTTGNNQEEDGVWWNIRSTIYSANPSTVHYLDSPSTDSAVTYKAQGKTSGSSHGFSFNRTGDGGNDLYNSPGFSQMTLMEVAA